MPVSRESFDKIAATGLIGGKDPASVRRRIEAMEKLLEGIIVIPGTNQRIGLDVILDILPVGGTVVAAVMGSYMAWEARNLGMSKTALIRMAGNIGFDALLGLIPVVGAVPEQIVAHIITFAGEPCM